MMKKISGLERLLSGGMAILLALMGILVFTNVCLRYFFNSGLVWAEELSRFFFVWLVFLGAIGALKDNNHLGFTSLVQRLPGKLKTGCFIVSNALVLWCLWSLLQGSWAMTNMTTRTLSPSMGVPLAYMYGVGVISSLGMIAIIAFNLYKAVFIRGSIDSLVVLKESEEELSLQSEEREVQP
ncbi:MAG: TRAP transporter small permease [Sporomusaceae bacterium]|nr:TRAP transporter small permease [Sporomusaceae bacterium]